GSDGFLHSLIEDSNQYPIPLLDSHNDTLRPCPLNELLSEFLATVNSMTIPNWTARGTTPYSSLDTYTPDVRFDSYVNYAGLLHTPREVGVAGGIDNIKVMWILTKFSNFDFLAFLAIKTARSLQDEALISDFQRK